MTEHLHLKPRHRAALLALLREHLPGVEVWAYGSRVSGRSHDGSDLDLVLRGPNLEEVPASQLANFKEAMREIGRGCRSGFIRRLRRTMSSLTHQVVFLIATRQDPCDGSDNLNTNAMTDAGVDCADPYSLSH